MRRVECEFEADALAAGLQGRWPDRVDHELFTHVAACPICSDVVALGPAFEEARQETRVAAQLPNAGLVWWRAQVRARREASDKAMTPISFTQMIGFGSAFGIVGACFGAASPWFQAVFARVVSEFSAENLQALVAVAAQHGFAVGGALALIVLVPAAVWLTASGD